MSDDLLITTLIPAYRASGTLGATLLSVLDPLERVKNKWNLEVIVVDDGSPDGAEINRICANFSQVQLLKLPRNGGKLSAVNAGARRSRGDVVMILDADDTLAPDWPAALTRLLAEWPVSAPVCYSACRNQEGRPTVADPAYRGWLSQVDLLNEHYTGEYLPLVRGEILRSLGYIPIPGGLTCEIVSYLRFAERGSFWVCPEVLRIYHDAVAESVSSGWGDAAKAEQMVRCYDALFARFADRYAALAPRVWRTKRLRLAVYMMLAGHPGALRLWWQAAALSVWKESLGSLLMCLLGRRWTVRLVPWLKQHGWVRRYG